MIFTAEYEYALRAIAFGIAIGGWVIARATFGQPLGHAWFGALACGMLGSIGTTLAVLPGLGPVPIVASIIGALMAGMLFSAGVRSEALHTRLGWKRAAVLFAIAVMVGIALEFGVPSADTRNALRQACVGLALLPSLLWIPRLWREGSAKVGTLTIAIVSLGIALDRTIPYLRALLSHGSVRTSTYPYVHRGDIWAIAAAALAMIVFSVERARAERLAPKALQN